MVIKADSKYKLKRLVKKLDSIRGRGTELITVYCPHDYELQEIVNQLREEEAEAGNIKSKRTRKNVKSALSKMIDHLKEFPRTPDNGLAVFCGNVSDQEGKTNIKLWDIEPPQPVEIKLYRCGKEFKLEPLEKMLVEEEDYGLIVLDTSEADFGVLKGKKIVSKQHISSLVPGKSKPGGQSAQRFERVREGLLDDYLKNAGDTAKQIFDLDKLKGVIVGGPGPIKERFIDEDYLPQKFKDSIITVKNTSYTGDQGFEELVKRSQEELKETKMREEKELINDMFNRLREDGKIAYGLDQVLKSIKLGAAEKVIVSEALDKRQVEIECECGYEGEEIIDEEEEVTCPECGNSDPEAVGEMDVFDALEGKAKSIGADIEIISTDTREGEQFYEMGGVAAFLRFKIQ